MTSSETPLVEVEWLDSTQADGAWRWIEDVHREVLVCRTVGWLLEEDDRQLTVAMSRAVDASGNVQVSGVVAIPRAAVERLRALTASSAASACPATGSAQTQRAP